MEAINNKVMTVKRKLTKISVPHQESLFLGAGHTSRAVMMSNFSETDPFMLLIDDVFEKTDQQQVDTPSLYAGFEAATLVLQGESGNGANKMTPGDFELATTGNGIIHSETIDKIITRRILSLWLGLPKQNRCIAPDIQTLPIKHVPKKYKNGVHIKVYSGSFADLTSPIQNNISLIMADIEMAPNVETTQEIPANYNSFIYVLRGSVKIGEEKKLLNEGEVGWLNIVDNEIQSELKLTAGEQGVRFVLYAAKPNGESIEAFSPFAGNTTEEVTRLNHKYSHDRMQSGLTVLQTQKAI
jgi:redox-sensitive bicupin YhaK (pirin superfamily)